MRYAEAPGAEYDLDPRCKHSKSFQLSHSMMAPQHVIAGGFALKGVEVPLCSEFLSGHRDLLSLPRSANEVQMKPYY